MQPEQVTGLKLWCNAVLDQGSLAIGANTGRDSIACGPCRIGSPKTWPDETLVRIYSYRASTGNGKKADTRWVLKTAVTTR